MENIKDSYKRLISSKEFNNIGIFSSAFIMTDEKELENSKWQMDFYNKENNKIITYLMKDKIEVLKNDEIFKDETTNINEIDLNNLNFKLENCLNIGKESLERDNETPVKVIIILQKLENLTWNLTYMSTKFNLINLKINAENGKVIEESISPLLNLKK